MEAPSETPHDELNGVPPRDPTELHPETKVDMVRLLRPFLGELLPLALRDGLWNFPP